MVIDSFSGKYRFLSNFFPADVVLDGEHYSTVEHAYQAAKTTDPMERKVIQIMQTPGLARSAGRSKVVIRHLRTNWESIKVAVMLGLLHQKFANHIMRSALRATGNATLIEGNTWGDKFWGQVSGEGDNMLGILLMMVRSELPIIETPYFPDADERPF